ncbi:hypothetical protein ACA910_011278 [Epithemia clementina (nom. ined.)]
MQPSRRFSFQAHAAAIQQPPEAGVVASWNDSSRWAQQQQQQLPLQEQQHHSSVNYSSLLTNGSAYRTSQASTHMISSRGRNALDSSNDTRQTFVWTRIFNASSSLQSLENNALQPPPRSGAASVVVCGRLYIFGGYGGGTGRLDDFYCFHFQSQTWETVQVLSEEKPGCRENNGVVIADDANRSIFLFGGYDGQNWLNDLWKFDIETKRWTCLQESTSASDDRHNSMYDGANDASQESTSTSVRSSLNNNITHSNGTLAPRASSFGNTSATIIRGRVPSRRFGYVSVVHEGRFIVWGGFDGSRWLNDMYVYTFATSTWTQVQQPLSSPEGGNAATSAAAVWPTVRSCPAWAKDDKYVYIQGGYDGIERKSDFFALDLSTYEWREMPCWGTPPSPRYFHSCGIHGNKLYLYGGYSGSERLADLYAYDFETQHWSRIDARGGEIPSGRSSLVLQVYEAHLYIFGGYNGSTVLNDFYKFRLKPINLPSTSLVQDLSKLIQNPDLSDVAFLVEGKLIYANRAILAIRSEYFRVMLCGGMREASSLDTTAAVGAENVSEKKPSVSPRSASQEGHRLAGDEIVLPGVSYEVFLRVLEFIYTDTLRINGDEMTLDLGIHLLIASELFMLDRLKALCEDLIRRDIHVDNVMDILVAAHRHNASGLKDLSLEYILLHLSNPTIMEGLTVLKSEPDLLVDIIKRHSLLTLYNNNTSSVASMDSSNGSLGHRNPIMGSLHHHHHHHHPQASNNDGAVLSHQEHHDLYYVPGSRHVGDSRYFVPSWNTSNNNNSSSNNNNNNNNNNNVANNHSRNLLIGGGGGGIQHLGDGGAGGLTDTN